MGTCLETGPVSENPVADGMRGGMTARIVSTQEQLNDSLGVGVEGSARYGLSTVDLKFSYSQSSSFNSTSTFVVAQCGYQNVIRRARGFRMPEG